MDLTLQCHCRVSRVRAVRHWRGVPPACRGQRVSPVNGVTGAIKAPRETRVHQVDYYESHPTAAGNRREKRRISAEKKKKKKRSCPRLFIIRRILSLLRTSYLRSRLSPPRAPRAKKIRKLQGFVRLFSGRRSAVITTFFRKYFEINDD